MLEGFPVTSRRRFLGAAAGGGVLAASSISFAAAVNRNQDVEARIAHRDFKNLYKEDLPTPCMVVDLGAFEKNLKTMSDHCRNTGIQAARPRQSSQESGHRQTAACAGVDRCHVRDGCGMRVDGALRSDGYPADTPANQQEQHYSHDCPG